MSKSKQTRQNLSKLREIKQILGKCSPKLGPAEQISHLKGFSLE